MGAEDWRSWVEVDQKEFVVEVEVEGEVETLRAYDIELDEPIGDSVFTPDGSWDVWQNLFQKSCSIRICLPLGGGCEVSASPGNGK